MEFVDQPYEKFLGTAKGGIFRTPGLYRRFRSQSERSGLAGEHSFSQEFAIHAIFPRQPELLQSVIEDFAIYASVLYELREADFYEISRDYDGLKVYKAGCDQDDPNRIKTGGDQVGRENRWEKAVISFTLLKAKIANTPILKHFDPDRQPVIVVYASKWAMSAALLQEYDGVFWPVIFTSRTLKANEINYGVAEKEVLALLRSLDICYTLLVSRDIKVFTRYSTLAWLLQSSGLNGRLGRWAALVFGDPKV